MDRMSPLDASFLWLEGENTPLHVGAVAIFEGPPSTYGDLVRLVVRKLHLVPRYRQKVRFIPMGLGRPVWADDAHFQVLYHIRHTAVPRPGSEEQLRNLAGRVLAQHLDRSKPLWELWLVEGLQDDRWALVAKTHHAVVDGIAGTDLLTVLFDQSRDAPLPDEVPWRPDREPSDVALVADALTDGLTSPLTLLRATPLAARAPVRGPRESLDVWRSVAAALARPKATPSSLNGPIGPHRRWSWVKASLAEVKEIRTVLGGTVNDVVLAAVTRGFRDLVLGRGEPVVGRVVRTMVPVSIRSALEKGSMNNRISAVFAELPIGIEDPVERLEEIRRQMDGIKATRQAVAGAQLTHMAGFAPAMWLDLSGRLAARLPQRLVQTLTTNVPGPQEPLYLLGRQLLDCYPYVPIAGQMRVGVVIFSYLGQLCFGLTGDYDSVPDLDVLGRGIEAGVAELREVAGAAGAAAAKPRTPARRRPKTATTSSGAARKATGRGSAGRPAARPAQSE